jgi:hypothetical protein
VRCHPGPAARTDVFVYDVRDKTYVDVTQPLQGTSRFIIFGRTNPTTLRYSDQD